MKAILLTLVCLQAAITVITAIASLCGRRAVVHVMPRWMRRMLRGYTGITLYPLGIFVQPEVWDAISWYNREKGRWARKVIRHESIHVEQQRETLGLFFLWYGVEYLFRRMFADHRDAYHGIAFEAEAYANDSDMDYLEHREPFAFTGYFRQRNWV